MIGHEKAGLNRVRGQRLLSALLALSVGLSALCAFPELGSAAQDRAGAPAKRRKKIAIGSFSGPKAALIRQEIIVTLETERVYDVSDVEGIGPDADSTSFRDYAQGLGVSAVIVGGIVRGNHLKVAVYDGASGNLLQEFTIRGGSIPRLHKEVSASLLMELHEPIERSRPPEPKREETRIETQPQPEPLPFRGDKAKRKKKKKNGSEDEKKPSDAGPSSSKPPIALELSGGLRLYNRQFTYRDTLAERFPGAGYPRLLNFQMQPVGPALSLHSIVYPISFLSSGFFSNLGIVLDYEYGFGVSVDPGTGQSASSGRGSLGTFMSQFHVGARFRLPFGAHEFGLLGGYGSHVFELTSQQATASSRPIFPNVSYSFIRLGADWRHTFDPFFVGISLTTRLLNSMGALNSSAWFPHAQGRSIDIEAMIGYVLSEKFDAVLGFDWLQYGFAFNPTVSAPKDRVAGGATDRTISGWLGVRFHLGERHRDARGAEEPQKAEANEDSDEPAPSEDGGESKTEADEET